MDNENLLLRESKLEDLRIESCHTAADEKAPLSMPMLQHAHADHMEVSMQEVPSSGSATTSSRSSFDSKEHLDLDSSAIKEAESRFFGLLSKLWGSNSEYLREKVIYKACSKALARNNMQDGIQKSQQSPTKRTRSSLPQALRKLRPRHQSKKSLDVEQGNRPPSPSVTKSLDIAGYNCQKAHIMISALYVVVEGLKDQKSLSKCNWMVEKQQSKYACFERHLKTTSKNLSARYARDGPRSLYQMMRRATWIRAEIEDEVRGLIIAKGMGGEEWREKKLVFTQKWASALEKAFPSKFFDCRWSKINKDTTAEAFLSGGLASSQCPWATAILFWDKLHATFPMQRTTDNILNGKKYYDFDYETIRAITEQIAPGFPLPRKVGERCAKNIEAVQTILSSFDLEIADEIDRRKVCKHVRPHRFHHSMTKTLQESLTVLQKMSNMVAESARRIKQMRLEPFESDLYQWKMLMDWGSLDGNSYRQLAGLTSDELVERLFEQPIPENEAVETNELFESIQTGHLQPRTRTIFLTRQEEKQRARERAKEGKGAARG